jgi:hypothetical protein
VPPWPAREFGVGLAFARASNHFGPVAPYSLIAAQAGFASIIGSNSTTTIAPWGGRDARVGNSPVGFGVPNPGGEPIILDMAVSVVARAKIRNALNRGQSIPPTWATDRDGKPTTDPQAAIDGFLQPIGGHKGYGLALIVDLFAGLLSGAAYLTRVKSWSAYPELAQDLGHFFFLIDAGRLGPPQWLAEHTGLHRDIARDTARGPGFAGARSGEIEIRNLGASAARHRHRLALREAPRSLRSLKGRIGALGADSPDVPRASSASWIRASPSRSISVARCGWHGARRPRRRRLPRRRGRREHELRPRASAFSVGSRRTTIEDHPHPPPTISEHAQHAMRSRAGARRDSTRRWRRPVVDGPARVIG